MKQGRGTLQAVMQHAKAREQETDFTLAPGFHLLDHVGGTWRKSSFLGLGFHHHPGMMLESVGAGLLLLKDKCHSPYPLMPLTPTLDHFLPFTRSH